MPEVPKSVYLVVGWKYISRTVSTVAFHVPRSSTPGKDVERAIDLRCPAVNVWLLDQEDYEGQGKKYLEEYERVAGDGTNYEPPVWKGPTTCNIIGSAPDAKTPQGRVLFRTRFGKDGSTTPGEDVERALSKGSTNVIIEVTRWGAVRGLRSKRELRATVRKWVFLLLGWKSASRDSSTAVFRVQKPSMPAMTDSHVWMATMEPYVAI